MKRRMGFVLFLIAACVASLAPAQLTIGEGPQPKKKKGDATRELRGTVTTPDGKVAARAVVQLRDSATQQIRSFITLDDGGYRFSGLKSDGNYQVRGELQDMHTDWKTLSAYDGRADPIINLKLEPNKAAPKSEVKPPSDAKPDTKPDDKSKK